MSITPEDERRYGLPPLPDVPFCGADEARRLNALYEAQRARYRELHPGADRLPASAKR